MSVPVSGDLVAGRYELTGSLGVGGMAEVHRAWDTDLRRPVAVKLFRPNADVDAVRRFDLEARTLARFSHPGVVSLYDAGLHGGKPFMVLQLVEGPTLRARMREGSLSVVEVRRLGAALAEALAHVHDQGVVHRDVKPSNILLDHAGTPHLADFGLAHSADAPRFTRTGHVPGTAAYLAPEQVRGAEVGPATDVYALGLVLLECLTGRREYAGSDVDAALARLHRPPTVPGDLPAELVRLLTLMTSLTPRRRPTAQDCATALGAAEGQLIAAIPNGTSPAGAPVVPTSRSGRSVSRKAIAVSAAGLVTAAVIAWTASSCTAPASTPADTTERTLSPFPTPSPAAAQVAETGRAAVAALAPRR